MYRVDYFDNLWEILYGGYIDYINLVGEVNNMGQINNHDAKIRNIVLSLKEELRLKGVNE